jgi:16S rRNA (guanine(966)-N(2))-methyltransferase RsmD
MSLRVQSGSARGRRLKALPRGYEVRPILARTRKSLFDILRPRMRGALFLDLYAGTGAVGIEALSNGAARAVFVDVDKWSCRMVERNLADLGFADRAEIVRVDASRNLAALGGRVFDVIFMGPPYKDAEKRPLALTTPTLARLAEAGVAGPATVVAAQHHQKEEVGDLPAGWEIVRREKYGDTRLTFLKMK